MTWWAVARAACLRERLAVLVLAARALPVDAQRAGPAGRERPPVLHAAHEPRDDHRARVAAALGALLAAGARPVDTSVVT
jgi:hypothetical protein